MRRRVEPLAQAGLLQPRARCAGAAAARPSPARASSSSTSRSRPRGVVDVAGAVRGRERRSSPASSPSRSSTSERCSAIGCEGERDVGHHVADEMRRAGDALGARGSPSPTAVEQSSRSLAWSVSDAVELLRHRAVEGAHAGLDVRDRDAGLRRRERARQRRVGVAVDEHHVGPLRGDLALQQRRACAPSARCCCRRRRAARGRAPARRARRRRRATSRRRSAGRCARSRSSWRSRSSFETAAALTNCGRLPMTVRIRMGGGRPRGCRRSRKANPPDGVSRRRRAAPRGGPRRRSRRRA